MAMYAELDAAVASGHLAPLVVPGGLIIIDDYALAGCAKAVHEYRDAHGIDAVLHLEDIGGAIIATWIA